MAATNTSSKASNIKPGASGGANPGEVIKGFQLLREEQRSIVTKMRELEQDQTEHK